MASTSEGCLYLNLFAPEGSAHSTRRLPVMVWIHGGALSYGESDDYDPAGLVHDGVIVVTINHRLGARGFLARPALAGRPGGPSGRAAARCGQPGRYATTTGWPAPRPVPADSRPSVPGVAGCRARG